MPTMTVLEPRTPKTAKVKRPGSMEKTAPEPVKHLESKIKKYLGILVTQKGSQVKVFSTTDSKVNVVIFPMQPSGTYRGDYFVMKTTDLRAEVRRELGY